MSAIVILTALATWVVLGYVLWRLLIVRHATSNVSRMALTILFAFVWLIGPFVDEFLGAHEFKRLCDELPPVKFNGPVSVGPGPFYNEDGVPKWKNSDEFSAILRRTNVWSELFETHESRSLISQYPIPVYEYRIKHRVKAEGWISVESASRFSPGGWIKRITGWGTHAPYQCPFKGPFPRDEQRIQFKKTSTGEFPR